MSNNAWLIVAIVAADLAVLVLTFLILQVIRAARGKKKYDYKTAYVEGDYYRLYPLGKSARGKESVVLKDADKLQETEGEKAAPTASAAPAAPAAPAAYAGGMYPVCLMAAPAGAPEAQAPQAQPQPQPQPQQPQAYIYYYYC